MAVITPLFLTLRFMPLSEASMLLLRLACAAARFDTSSVMLFLVFVIRLVRMLPVLFLADTSEVILPDWILIFP